MRNRHLLSIILIIFFNNSITMQSPRADASNFTKPSNPLLTLHETNFDQQQSNNASQQELINKIINEMRYCSTETWHTLLTLLFSINENNVIFCSDIWNQSIDEDNFKIQALKTCLAFVTQDLKQTENSLNNEALAILIENLIQKFTEILNKEYQCAKTINKYFFDICALINVLNLYNFNHRIGEKLLRLTAETLQRYEQTDWIAAHKKSKIKEHVNFRICIATTSIYVLKTIENYNTNPIICKIIEILEEYIKIKNADKTMRNCLGRKNFAYQQFKTGDFSAQTLIQKLKKQLALVALQNDEQNQIIARTLSSIINMYALYKTHEKDHKSRWDILRKDKEIIMKMITNILFITGQLLFFSTLIGIAFYYIFHINVRVTPHSSPDEDTKYAACLQILGLFNKTGAEILCKS